MFSEILKIIPKLDRKDIEAIAKTLNTRFAKIAKSFGKGMVSAIKGGGVLGAGLALIDKLLNPLKETQEAMDRILKSSDDVVTNAKQFNTSSGRLFKLIGLAKSTGLDQDNLFLLITKFQTAVAEAKANPKNENVSSVRNFVDNPDTAASFFEFIQSLQKMDKNTQVLVQQQVFGEKQILKMADFIQTDFAAQIKLLGGKPGDNYTKSLEKLGALNDLQDAKSAKRDFDDILAKANVMNEGMINSRDRSERLLLDQENNRIASFQNLQAIADTSTKIMGLMEQGLNQLGKLINVITPTINRLADAMNKMSVSRFFRGMFGGEDK